MEKQYNVTKKVLDKLDEQGRRKNFIAKIAQISDQNLYSKAKADTLYAWQLIEIAIHAGIDLNELVGEIKKERGIQ